MKESQLDSNVGTDQKQKTAKIHYSPVCLFCRHYHRGVKISDRNICDAFLEGIPYEIWCGANDHSEPYPGDNGIRCEARLK